MQLDNDAVTGIERLNIAIEDGMPWSRNDRRSKGPNEADSPPHVANLVYHTPLSYFYPYEFFKFCHRKPRFAYGRLYF